MDVISRNQGALALEVPLPGPLCGEVYLRLESIQAARLVNGRSKSADKPQIWGLIGFAQLLRPIWAAAADTDPMAYATLLNIEKAMARVDRTLDEFEKALNELPQSTRLHHAQTRSIRPADYPLNFEVPYAFESAQRLARFDEQVLVAMTRARMAQISPAGQRELIGAPAKALRHLFAMPAGFRQSDGETVPEGIGTLGPAMSDLTAGRLPRHLPRFP